ncbi:MAG: tetratricopeptide repeat protein, partial [Blastocatellia bacterium]
SEEEAAPVSNQRESPRGKRVASEEEAAPVSNQRESPRDKRVASKAEVAVQTQSSKNNSQTKDALAAYQKADALFRDQKLEQSLAAVEEALRLNPKLVPALTLKARLAMAANRFDVATACLQQAVEIEPNSAGNQFLLGFALYVENDFSRALESLDRAARLKPDDARAQFYLALTLEGLGRTGDAIVRYEGALKLDKENGAQLADTLVAYARLLFTLGRYDESEKLIDRALAVEGDSRDAQYEKGRLRLERHDYAAAIKYGKKALELPGAGFASGERMLGLAYAEVAMTGGDHFHETEALRLLTKALKQHPRDAEILARLGFIHSRRGDEARAGRAYEIAWQLDPRRADALVNLGAAWAALGKTEEAIKLWRDALQRNAGLTEAAINLARVYRSQGKLLQAREVLQQALRFDPDSGAARLLLKELESR